MKSRVILGGVGVALFGLGLLVGQWGDGGGGLFGGEAAAEEGGDGGMASGVGMKSVERGHLRESLSEMSVEEKWLTGAGRLEMAALLRDGDQASRIHRLVALLERAGEDGMQPLLEEILESPFAGLFGDETELIIAEWTRRNPYAALEYLRETDGSRRLKFAAMAAWASHHPDAAEQWARDHAKEGEANEWMVGVIRGLAGTSTEKAAALILEMPKSREQWSAMVSTMPYVLEKGTGYATEWIDGLGNGELQINGAKWMGNQLARLDPAEAASWIETVETDEARREGSAEVALRYAESDLDKAQEWVSGLPEHTRTEAAEGVVQVMAKEDVRGAVAWLEQQGDDMDYDGAWVDLVRNGFENDPGVALVGALRLANEDWRRRYTGGYLSRWMKQDKEAAEAWVTDYLDYLPENLARRYGPKPVKKAKTTGAVFAKPLELAFDAG